jgi:uncharacterized protein
MSDPLASSLETFLSPRATSLEAGADPRLPDDLRQRLPASERAARANAQRAATAAAKDHRGWSVRFSALQKAQRKPVVKLMELRSLTDASTRPIAEVAACRKGCSHCCHIPVALSQGEADLIGQEIGLKPMRLAPESVSVGTDYGYHRPCPFLVDGSCSIYASRPLSCRWHFNLDTDATLCELREMPVPVPLADMRRYQWVYATITVDQAVADIRDFFPPERVASRKKGVAGV